MVTTHVIYTGDLRCEATHAPSGSVIETDAPADNHGKAQRFSPTDLVGAALGTCIVTTIGIAGQRKGWNLAGMRINVDKEMSATPPRRIDHLAVELWMPVVLQDEDRTLVETIAHACPIHASLHPDVRVTCTIHWPV
jgi:putative redox protein